MFKTLISTEQLAENIDNPQWVIFDCRFTLTDAEAGMTAYEKQHLPRAIYAHLEDDLSGPITPTTGRHPLPDPQTLARKLGEWGVDETKQVVVYDDSFGSVASRMWWLLRWLGHEAVALLNGGIQKWQREGRLLTADIPDIKPARFTPLQNNQLCVDTANVEQAIQQGGFLIIDARAEERFTGEVEPFDKIAGHIPGAINIPYEDNLDFTSEFLSAEELCNLYGEKLNGVPSDKVILMCGSGVTACHNVLAMEHAGLHNVKLYTGSWSEWITDEQRPVATGE
jgi:thiosulfate/3-mercaptopyruvate sulfurtransferase